MISTFPKIILEPKKKYTLEQFIEKEAKSEIKHEFINGQIVKMPFARGPHNIITANILSNLHYAVSKKKKNYLIFGSDQMIYFPNLNEGVYADTLAVAEKPIYWDDQQLLLINPIVVVEVLSKSTQKYDRTSKYDKYKSLESFKEYVLVRQDEHYVELRYREKPNLWRETIYTDLNDQVSFKSLDIKISMSLFYKNVEILKLNK